MGSATIAPFSIIETEDSSAKKSERCETCNKKFGHEKNRKDSSQGEQTRSGDWCVRGERLDRLVWSEADRRCDFILWEP